MDNTRTSDPLEIDTSFRRRTRRQSLGLSTGETAHLSRAAASILASLSERQLRLAGENFFSYFDVRHELIALQIEQIERPSEAKAVPARLREIGRKLARNASGARRSALDKRLDWIGGVLSLDKSESQILGVIVRVAMFDSWQQLAEAVPFKVNNPSCELLALVTGLSLVEIDERLAPGSRLLSSGMVVGIAQTCSRWACLHVFLRERNTFDRSRTSLWPSCVRLEVLILSRSRGCSACAA